MQALEDYLTRNGFAAEAALAHQADRNPKARAQLERALGSAKPKLPIPPDLAEMEALLHLFFGQSMDLILQHRRIGSTGIPALLTAINGMADRSTLQEALDLFLTQPQGEASPTEPDDLLQWLAERRSTVLQTQVESFHMNKALQHLLDGHTLLLLQGAQRALVLSAPGWETRSIEEPQTERVIRGPREGFVEALATNTSMLRRRVRDERLRIELMRIGAVTGTRVALVYLSGICKQPLVEEARRRLGRIKTDAVIDTGYLEEFIEDTPWTVFPLIKSTERPDSAAAALAEGRFVILADGSPFALVAPCTFNDQMQSPEDYYERFPMVIMLRLLRWGFATVALLGPAFYVAFTTFHQEMIPTPLLLSIMSSREGVPFPAVLEALIMEIAFEALREAGVRMPKTVGQAISIVGALVIGQAAVQAGFISAPMVIVVSLTGLASFVIPKFSAAISLRLLRFVMLFLAGTFGVYGITLGVVAVLTHLISLRSFGDPYYAPMAPLLPSDLDDDILRLPHWNNTDRPAGSEALDRTRTRKGLRPGPHHRPNPPKKES